MQVLTDTMTGTAIISVLTQNMIITTGKLIISVLHINMSTAVGTILVTTAQMQQHIYIQEI